MDMNQLVSFIAAADCGSFSKASVKLYISSTAIMKQINMLEKDIGVKLLRRTNRGVYMTDAGKSFYNDAKFMIKLFDESVRRARKAGHKDIDTIRAGSSILYPGKSFMDLWSRISDKYPEFRINVVPFIDSYSKMPELLKGLGKNGFDMIVGACNSKYWLSICDFYELGSYDVCCAVPVSHRLASKDTLNIQDLYGETLMMIQRGDSEILDSIRDDIEASHTAIKIENTPPFYDISVFNCCEQNGNVLLTLDIWSEIHPSLKTIPMEWDYKMPYGILYRSGSTEYIDSFIEIIKKEMAKVN